MMGCPHFVRVLNDRAELRVHLALHNPCLSTNISVISIVLDVVPRMYM